MTPTELELTLRDLIVAWDLNRLGDVARLMRAVREHFGLTLPERNKDRQ